MKEIKLKEKKITCRTCGRHVSVKLIPYGEGNIAICPKCGKIAYNGK